MFLALAYLCVSTENEMYMTQGIFDGVVSYIPTSRFDIAKEAMEFLYKHPELVTIKGSKEVLERLKKMFPEPKKEANHPLVTVAKVVAGWIISNIDIKIVWNKSEEQANLFSVEIPTPWKFKIVISMMKDGVEEKVHITEIQTSEGFIYLPSYTEDRFENLQRQLLEGKAKLYQQ